MSELVLPGLLGGSPAAALALYGIASLLPGGSTVRWLEHGSGNWVAAADTRAVDVIELSATLVDAIKGDGLEALENVAKDINEVTPDRFATRQSGAVHRVLAGLAAEAPLRRPSGNVAITPICTYSFGTRGTLFGNAVKQDAALTVDVMQRLLAGEGREQKGVNTLGFDPAARRQDGAVIGPDPSADGVRGVPGLVPLVLRGLATVAPMPGTARTQGGAFVRSGRQLEFRWPVFSPAVRCDALAFLVARDWATRSPAQRRASGVDAVYASTVLRDERRLAAGRRVA